VQAFDLAGADRMALVLLLLSLSIGFKLATIAGLLSAAARR